MEKKQKNDNDFRIVDHPVFASSNFCKGEKEQKSWEVFVSCVG